MIKIPQEKKKNLFQKKRMLSYRGNTIYNTDFAYSAEKNNSRCRCHCFRCDKYLYFEHSGIVCVIFV